MGVVSELLSADDDQADTEVPEFLREGGASRSCCARVGPIDGSTWRARTSANSC